MPSQNLPVCQKLKASCVRTGAVSTAQRPGEDLVNKLDAAVYPQTRPQG